MLTKHVNDLNARWCLQSAVSYYQYCIFVSWLMSLSTCNCSILRYFSLTVRNVVLMVCHFSKKPSTLSKPHMEMTIKPSRRVSWLHFLCSKVWYHYSAWLGKSECSAYVSTWFVTCAAANIFVQHDCCWTVMEMDQCMTNETWAKGKGCHTSLEHRECLSPFHRPLARMCLGRWRL